MSSKKKAAVSASGRTETAKKKTGAKRRKATPRQVKLLKGLVDGKSQRQAALDAGYSERMARHPGELLSTEVMRSEIQARFSLDKICQRIDEGMDAEITESLVLGRKGKEKVITSSFPNHSERRQAAALAAKLMGADPSSKIELKGDVNTFVRVEFVDVATQESA